MVGMMGVVDKQRPNSLLFIKHSAWVFPEPPHVPSSITCDIIPPRPHPNRMLPLRVGVNFTSTFARSAAAKRVGSQLARQSYVRTAPARRSNLLLYLGLAGAGIGLHTYGPNSVYCDSMEMSRSTVERAC